MPPVDAFIRQSGAALAHDAYGRAGIHPGADLDHVRAARPGDLYPVRRAAQRRHRELRGPGVRGLLERADLRERRGIQRPDAGLPAASYVIEGIYSPHSGSLSRSATLAWVASTAAPAAGTGGWRYP